MEPAEAGTALERHPSTDAVLTASPTVSHDDPFEALARRLEHRLAERDDAFAREWLAMIRELQRSLRRQSR